MRHVISGGLVAAAVLFVAALPTSAQVARPQSALAAGNNSGDLLVLAQARARAPRAGVRRAANVGRARAVRVTRAHYPRRYRIVQRYRYYYGYPYWGWPWGWGGGVTVGLGAPYYGGYYVDGAVAYCMSRFRSYDPVSRTYLGYDGRRHPCP